MTNENMIPERFYFHGNEIEQFIHIQVPVALIKDKIFKTAAQVVLHWNIQRGVVIIPKSTHKERMEQNFNVLDFALTQEEMDKISVLTLDRSEIIDHFGSQIVKMILGLKIHA